MFAGKFPEPFAFIKMNHKSRLLLIKSFYIFFHSPSEPFSYSEFRMYFWPLKFRLQICPGFHLLFEKINNVQSKFKSWHFSTAAESTFWNQEVEGNCSPNKI